MEHRLSRSQPNQPIIAKKVDHEEAMDIITEKNPDVQNLEEKKQDEIVPKTYACVDRHFKKRPYRKSKKRCWYCGSPYHVKRNCSKIRCFYCLELGHMKQNCWKKKLDYAFARLKEPFL